MYGSFKCELNNKEDRNIVVVVLRCRKLGWYIERVVKVIGYLNEVKDVDKL